MRGSARCHRIVCIGAPSLWTKWRRTMRATARDPESRGVVGRWAEASSARERGDWRRGALRRACSWGTTRRTGRSSSGCDGSGGGRPGAPAADRPLIDHLVRLRGRAAGGRRLRCLHKVGCAASALVGGGERGFPARPTGLSACSVHICSNNTRSVHTECLGLVADCASNPGHAKTAR